jgi:hypothetical protein
MPDGVSLLPRRKGLTSLLLRRCSRRLRVRWRLSRTRLAPRGTPERISQSGAADSTSSRTAKQRGGGSHLRRTVSICAVAPARLMHPGAGRGASPRTRESPMASQATRAAEGGATSSDSCDGGAAKERQVAAGDAIGRASGSPRGRMRQPGWRNRSRTKETKPDPTDADGCVILSAHSVTLTCVLRSA